MIARVADDRSCLRPVGCITEGVHDLIESAAHLGHTDVLTLYLRASVGDGTESACEHRHRDTEQGHDHEHFDQRESTFALNRCHAATKCGRFAHETVTEGAQLDEVVTLNAWEPFSVFTQGAQI